MTLTPEQLTALFTNCTGTQTVGGRFIEPVRFSDAQDAHYAKVGFGTRAHCTAGIALDFTYDGSLIAFDYIFTGCTSRIWFTIDLYADGVMLYTLNTLSTGEGQTHFEYRFDEKKPRRVQIYLPYTCGIALAGFTVDDGAAVTPTDRSGAKKLLLLGDSITHGSDARYTSRCYATLVGQHFDAVALNQGVGGYFFDERVIDETLAFKPDAITVAYGTNDWGRHKADADGYRAAAKAYIDKLCRTYPDVPIFGILPLWRTAEILHPDWMPFAKIYDILGELYGTHGNVTVVNGRSIVPNLREYYTDGLHPNTMGQEAYARGVILAMEHAGFTK